MTTTNMTDTTTPDSPATETPFARMTSRKFMLALDTLGAASLLLWFGRIEPLVWRDVVIATVGAYIAANVTQRVMTKAAT